MQSGILFPRKSAMDEAKIRPVQIDDFDAVTRLLVLLGRAPVGEAEREVCREVFRRHVESPDTASLVAEIDGRAAGFCSLVFRERLNYPRPQAWIPDLIVEESARGRGLGKKLLEAAFEAARRRGCCAITLETGYQRKVAQALYRKAGMVNPSLVFSKNLEGRWP